MQKHKHGWVWEDDTQMFHKCSACGRYAEEVVTGGHLTGCDDPSGEIGGYFIKDSDELLSKYCPWCGKRMWFAEEETEWDDEEDERGEDE